MTALLLAGGCTPKETLSVRTPGPVADQPIADEATQLRGFSKSVAFYQNGSTQGWPTRWYYVPNQDCTTPIHFVADPIMFLMQTASLPVTMAMEPPFQIAVIYGSDVLIPSYTAMPPLPPEEVSGRAVPDPDPLSAPQRPVAPPLPPILPQEPPTIAQPRPHKARAMPATEGATTPTTQPESH